jgi:D-alanyl-lipoteichoic acid acyltransferase DltB (MBOAT superfamily)
LPIVLVGYFLLAKVSYYFVAKLWLIIFSFIFYAMGSPWFFPFFLASVTGNYIIGNILGQLFKNEDKNADKSLCFDQRKCLLLMGIIANVLLLGYYKYTNFFITNINNIAHTDIALHHIILPIGISFFTFQLIAFLVDSYRGLAKSYSILDYLLFITFFPQLIVGPIVHHGEIVPQFEDKSKFIFNWESFATGLFLFSIGCAKKILLADPLTMDARPFFQYISETPAFVASWWYSIEYTISYYFDLSGYADMAIGLGKMFNISIPENFNSPYKARNFQDYWQRWHITLSRFLGDYVFRSVYKKDKLYRNYYITTMVTFFVSGFWHGAGWHFIAWGLINGLFVCAASWMKRREIKLPAAFAHSLTILGIIVLRVLFVASLVVSLRIYSGMLNISLSDLSQIFSFFKGINKILLLKVFISILLIAFFPNSRAMVGRFKATWFSLLFSAILMFLSLLNMGNAAAFLYFQF